jgi:pimeloyl-ACP methyl ester carboxylesterase
VYTASVCSLVFLPGAGGRAAFWSPVAERLRELGPQVLMAWPGFGDVPADPGIRSLDDLHGWLLARLPAGRLWLVAQSMGGVLAIRLAIEAPERVGALVLSATSGGVDVAGMGGEDWRARFRAELPHVPDWFERDRTDLTEQLDRIRAPTLILYSDADPICPPAVAALLQRRIPNARAALVPGGTHAFAHERPDAVAEHVRAHLSGLAASGGPR